MEHSNKDIQECIDKMAIKDVLSKYAITMDAGDPDGFAALFTDDAVWEWEGVGLILEGKETLRQLAAAVAEHVPGGQHMVSNPVIEVSGDTATSICQFTVFLSRPEKIYTIMIGNYQDDLKKNDGRWLIAYRRVYVENPEILSQGKIGEYYKPLMANLRL